MSDQLTEGSVKEFTLIGEEDGRFVFRRDGKVVRARSAILILDETTERDQEGLYIDWLTGRHANSQEFSGPCTPTTMLVSTWGWIMLSGVKDSAQRKVSIDAREFRTEVLCRLAYLYQEVAGMAASLMPKIDAVLDQRDDNLKELLNG